MHWFNDISTRSKLLASFGLMVVFLAVVMALAYRSITATQQSQKHLYEMEFANVENLWEIRSQQNGIRASQLTMLVADSQAERQTFRQDIERRVGLIDKDT